MRGDDIQPDDRRLTVAVQAAQDGDEAAFRTVYRAVHPRLLGYVRTLVSEPDVEDVTSEAWLQITRDLARFSGDADRFRGWAARIARNRALDHIRMRGRRPAIGGDESELADTPGASDTAGEALEALGTGRTMRLISRLPQDQAEAVVLRVVVGLDAKSAAEVLGNGPGRYAPPHTADCDGSPSSSARNRAVAGTPGRTAVRTAAKAAPASRKAPPPAGPRRARAEVVER